MNNSLSQSAGNETETAGGNVGNSERHSNKILAASLCVILVFMLSVVLSFWWWSSRKKRRARKKLDESKTVEIPATVEERLRNYEGNAGDTMMTQCDRTLHRTLPIPEAF